METKPRSRKSAAVDDAIEHAKKTFSPTPIRIPREQAQDGDNVPNFKDLVKSYRTQAPSTTVLLKALGNDNGGLITFLSAQMTEAVARIPEPYLNLDEEEMKANLARDFEWHPSVTVENLRIKFWEEFDRCQIAKEPKMVQEQIYRGVCSVDYFFTLCADQYKWPVWAYIITRPTEYDQVMRSMLSLATSRLRDILSIPILNKNGEPRDPKLIDTILKAAAMVDHRVKGSYIQHTVNKTLQINHNTTTHKGSIVHDIRAKPIEELDYKEIQERLRLVERDLQEDHLASEKIIDEKFGRKKIDVVDVEAMDVTPKQKRAVDREGGFEV
jgi:hypothetical protein